MGEQQENKRDREKETENLKVIVKAVKFHRAYADKIAPPMCKAMCYALARDVELFRAQGTNRKYFHKEFSF